jgi:hopanoid biosynthesis associated RND transporter like protein HpnN
MLKSTIVKLVAACTCYPWTIIGLSLLVALLSALYTAQHFKINTDINKLISDKLDWRQREAEFEKAFPGRYDSILVVVDAPTHELATEASAALARRLAERKDLFRAVRQPDAGEFFEKNGLLFLPTDEVERTAKSLGEAQPLIDVLATDPTLRGLSQALSFALTGVDRGMLELDKMTRTLNGAAETIENVMAGKPAVFSWYALVNGPPEAKDLRRFIDVRPVLDFAALEPGRAASDYIRKAAADLALAKDYNARVRLTGPVAIADEEFATVQEGAMLNAVVTVLIVLLILWLALRSFRIILAVFFNMVVGLAITAALGLLMVGALNLISVAFAVLFVGLGVDFGIQFAVRYRSMRYEVGDLRAAVVKTAEDIGLPLTLAAAAVAAGFLSFLPTEYKGVSELGLIAGFGMLIAYLTSVTLLPALLTVLNPPGEPEEVGYRALAPVDRFLERHRIGVLVGTAVVVIAGLPLLYFLHFDFNPLNLRNPKVESVSTLLELRNDPNMGINSVNVVVPKLDDVPPAAERLSKLPEVSRTMSLYSFVPADQEPKLAAIRAMEKELEPSFKPEAMVAPPTDEENVSELTGTAEQLAKVASTRKGPGAEAGNRLAAAMSKLAKADKAMRDMVEPVFVRPLKTSLNQLQNLLHAQPVSLETLPQDLREDWVAQDGRARVEASPKGDPNDTEALRAFALAVQKAFPTAVGGPISILESGNTVVKAFVHAGIWALLSIAVLLWIVLRRFGDVMLTLIPLLLAGVVTLEFCVLIGMPLNFANIVALPLLLGVGVAFKIYYITAWRAGQTDLLQSSLTRAVIWSALTTATAFGSLWLSSHPGTSSMGKLLAMSLVSTLAAAVLFQPALMGKPREAESSGGAAPERNA